jgi:hypothetical protein
VTFQCEKATFNPGNVCFGKGMQETVDMNKCHRGNIMRTWYIWKAETRWTGNWKYSMGWSVSACPNFRLWGCLHASSWEFRVWHMGLWNISILVSIYVSVVSCDLMTLFKSEVMTLNLDYVYCLLVIFRKILFSSREMWSLLVIFRKILFSSSEMWTIAEQWCFVHVHGRQRTKNFRGFSS